MTTIILTGIKLKQGLAKICKVSSPRRDTDAFVHPTTRLSVRGARRQLKYSTVMYNSTVQYMKLVAIN